MHFYRGECSFSFPELTLKANIAASILCPQLKSYKLRRWNRKEKEKLLFDPFESWAEYPQASYFSNERSCLNFRFLKFTT
jgi:hypothetical protein